MLNTLLETSRVKKEESSMYLITACINYADVGLFHFPENLMNDVSKLISDQMMEGTLGGFVNFNNGEMGFITCAHVCFDLSNTNASQTSFEVVQPSYGYRNKNNVCGGHERSVFPANPYQGITVDASLIRLTRRAPQRGLFSELRADDLSEVGT